MKHSFKTLIGAAVVASIVGAASIASAVPADKVTAKCHATIAKNIGKYQATLAKNIASCHKSRSAGKILASVNCNTAAGADLKSKNAATRTKVIAAIEKACVLPDSQAVLDLYPRCPSPAATSDDAGTSGIDNFNDLGKCLTALSEGYISLIGGPVLGAPTAGAIAAPLSKGQLKCQGAIGKGFAGAVKGVVGAHAKCQAGVEKALGELGYSTCQTDTSGKAAAALTKMSDGIDKACLAANMPDKASFGALNLCGSTISDLKTCAITKVTDSGTRGLAAVAQLIPNSGGNLICASRADVLINAANGHKSSSTRLDSGWTGAAHNVDVIDYSVGGVLLENCNADCDNCDVRIDKTIGTCRCSNDVTIECSTVEAADVACGGNTCNCFFGPPLALSAGGSPVCAVNRFAQEFTGGTSTVGEYDVQSATRTRVHGGLSLTRPCPTCVGDPTRNDGIRGGTCNGGDRDTLACDINAVHPDFGATSFDCLPTLASNFTGSGLKLALQFSSGSVSFTAGLPTGANCTGGNCHCSQCTLDSSIGCASNADCSGGAGTCGVVVSPLPQQNQCDGGPGDCAANVPADGMGHCNTGPFDTFCDGALRANGAGIIPCANDGECAAVNSQCPGNNCGSCTIPGERSCFLPTISATGKPGIFNSEGVSAFCSAQTSSGPVNTAGGLPGPGRVRLDFDFNVYCPDGVTIMQLPGGLNCP